MEGTGQRNAGHLEAIWIKRAHGGPMDAASRATLVAGEGISGNADRSRRRQVTLIEHEVWADLMRRLHADLDPSTRRGNLMLSGVRLAETRDRILEIGPCRIRILGEVKPCEQMEAALPGLEAAMYDHWQGGAFGEVLEGGEIQVGDVVRFV